MIAEQSRAVCTRKEKGESKSRREKLREREMRNIVGK